MLAEDAIVLKINEEAIEVGIEAGQLAQLCDKTIRFGMDSWHPQDEHRTTNHDLLWTRFRAVQSEYHDLTVAMWLLQLHRAQEGLGNEEAVLDILAREWFRDAASTAEAVRKLRRFDRLLPAMLEKGSIEKPHLEKLQHTLVIGINFLEALAAEQLTRAAQPLGG
jgi:hypothetical protein